MIGEAGVTERPTAGVLARAGDAGPLLSPERGAARRGRKRVRPHLDPSVLVGADQPGLFDHVILDPVQQRPAVEPRLEVEVLVVR